MSQALALEALLKRDRMFVLAGLVGLAGLAWLYLVWMAAAMDMGAMGEAMVMARIEPWTAGELVLMFVMWAIMMVGMMLPSAAPMILLYAAIDRKQRRDARPFAPTSAFVAGYLAVWTGFSLLATVLQWALQQTALLSPMLVATTPILGGLLLIAAGVYQWTPFKDVCLEHCRGPLHFIVHRWRKGARGAFVMGLEHGAFCVGCCWLLMGLLFFGGVMNLLWVAAIAAFVLIEKVAPRGDLIGRTTGGLLFAAGVWVIAAGVWVIAAG